MTQQPSGTPVVQAGQAAPLIIVCPSCQKPTDSLKRLRVMHLFIFVILFVRGRAVDYTACPACMRGIIVKRTLINVVTANFVWPIVLIFNLVPMVRTFSSGPSDSIRKEFGRA